MIVIYLCMLGGPYNTGVLSLSAYLLMKGCMGSVCKIFNAIHCMHAV